MKKILSLLLALSLLFGMTGMAVADTAGVLVDGDNEIELPWDTDQASVFTYTATQTGTLYIAATEFYSDDAGDGYQDNTHKWEEWSMYTQLTVNGQMLDGFYYGGVEVVEGQTYTIVWSHKADVVNKTWYDLGWLAVINLSYSDELVPKRGSKELPVELYRENCPVDSIEIPAGESVYYLLQDFFGTEFQVIGEAAAVLPRAQDPATGSAYSEPIKAVDGVVTVPVENDALLIRIDNTGEEDAVFQLDYYLPVGTATNPDQLKQGQNFVSTEKNDEIGYFYTWTAQCNGKLILTFQESGWLGSVKNLTTSENKWFDYGGSNPVVIEVSKGDVLLINIMAARITAMGATFGGDVTFTAATDYAHSYVDGICAHCGRPDVLVGDANDDGEVDARDARAILRLMAKMIDKSDLNMAAADINGDGEVDARDARAILRKLANMD